VSCSLIRAASEASGLGKERFDKEPLASSSRTHFARIPCSPSLLLGRIVSDFFDEGEKA
jgi:hypothetical protein